MASILYTAYITYGKSAKKTENDYKFVVFYIHTYTYT